MDVGHGGALPRNSHARPAHGPGERQPAAVLPKSSAVKLHSVVKTQKDVLLEQGESKYRPKWGFNLDPHQENSECHFFEGKKQRIGVIGPTNN